MNTAIIAAIITGVISLAGTIMTILASSKKTDQNIRINQAVMQERMDELTREVRAHNNFAARMPVVEEQIKSLNHRVSEIENGGKK